MNKTTIILIIILAAGFIWFAPIIPYKRSIPVQCIQAPCDPQIIDTRISLGSLLLGDLPGTPKQSNNPYSL